MGGLPADCRLGVAPHSLRAVAQEDIERLERLAPSGPIHMHLAEQQEEVDEVLECHGARPVTWFLDNCHVSPRWCLVHCTRMDKQEAARLAGTGAVAGLCPVTEANLGDGIFEAQHWFGNRGAIAIGSDSNIRISLTEELRALEYSQRLRDRARAVLSQPDRSTGRFLFEAISKGGATAAKRTSGRIEEGVLADLLALDIDSLCLAGLAGDSLLDSYIFTGDDRLVTDVWAAGRHLVRNGQHVKRDQIVEKYRQTMSELRDAL
jgi:formimidoylglutamate deiminase